MHETILYEECVISIKGKNTESILKLLDQINENNMHLLTSLCKKHYALVHLMAMYGLTEGIKKIRGKFGAQSQTILTTVQHPEGYTPFIFAVLHCQRDLVLYFLAQNIDDFATPVHQSMFFPTNTDQHYDIKDFNTPDAGGNFPIAYAAVSGDSTQFELSFTHTLPENINKIQLIRCMLIHDHEKLIELFLSKYTGHQHQELVKIIKIQRMNKISWDLNEAPVILNTEESKAVKKVETLLTEIVKVFMDTLGESIKPSNTNEILKLDPKKLYGQWNSLFKDETKLNSLSLCLSRIEVARQPGKISHQLLFMPLVTLNAINTFCVWINSFEDKIVESSNTKLLKEYYRIRLQIYFHLNNALTLYPEFGRYFIWPIKQELFKQLKEESNNKFTLLFDIHNTSIDLESNRPKNNLPKKLSTHSNSKQQTNSKKKIIENKIPEKQNSPATMVSITPNDSNTKKSLNAKQRAKLRKKAKDKEKLGTEEQITEKMHAALSQLISSHSSETTEIIIYSPEELTNAYGKLFKFSQRVINFIRCFEEKTQGNKLYVVGGAVRDNLCGKKSNDVDFVTMGINLEKIKELFPEAKFKGQGYIQSISIPQENDAFSFDIVTCQYVKADNYLECLKTHCGKRDLTINAMLWHPKEGLIDFYHGLNDLFQKKINPIDFNSMQNDLIRLMRAVRFVGKFDFDMDKELKQAIKSRVKLIFQTTGFQVNDQRLLQEYKCFLNDMGFDKANDLLRQYGMHQFLIYRNIIHPIITTSIFKKLDLQSQQALGCVSQQFHSFFKIFQAKKIPGIVQPVKIANDAILTGCRKT
jgi:hypothetical protein